MSLERLVEEIRARAEEEAQRERRQFEAEAKVLQEEREKKVARLRDEAARQLTTDIARERAQRIAGAKLAARKKVYGAKERRMVMMLENAKQILSDFTSSDQYEGVLRRMFEEATRSLGRSIRVRGRPEDDARLKAIAARSFDPTPEPILGGLIAETVDGHRRLDLSLDELLRLREDRVRALLTE